MYLEHVARKFERLQQQRGIVSSFGEPATETLISQVENNLGVSFPAKVTLFYNHFNGLHVEDPHVDIFPIEQMRFLFPNRLHFATFDHSNRVFFDTSQINDAGQWNILAEDGFRITLTMPSLWSAHLWGWVEWRRVIWRENPEWVAQWEREAERERLEEQRAT